MEEDKLDCLLVPLGLLLLASYHVWLLFTVLKHPTRTVIGLNAESRHQWVFAMMTDPLKNGVLAVQTIRNNIMASTLLATIAITLSSLISVFVSSSSDSGNATSEIVYGNKSPLLSSIKYFSILLCFLVAFLCNVQSIRYYAHVSFLATLPSSRDNMETVEYVARNLNRGSYFWSLGLRAFYLAFPLLLWIFGPIPMFLCCCVMSFLLYFLDTTSNFTRDLHRRSFKEDMLKGVDLESTGPLSEKIPFGESNLYCPLLHAGTNFS
ncbi:uncharacterized protein LOC110422768 isoform X1 [Herrania umbratica]|uniref:Uncharacterized protein LOC110422768 isoform X1 n=1 Tax=Herrania umbratica TaxID=108875 RepID=A0A6J1AZP0_9ROSI|nr:uncharacterized protein LOC110422768 isoform X1 [Herrania umbratica]XP_021292458.1 uncharacterized protein LOC110422768 isoform X1 [Herrania umbratica]